MTPLNLQRQHEILRCVAALDAARETVTVTRLMTELDLPRQTIRVSLVRLHQGGLVVHDPGKRHHVPIQITPAGREQASRIGPRPARVRLGGPDPQDLSVTFDLGRGGSEIRSVLDLSWAGLLERAGRPERIEFSETDLQTQIRHLSTVILGMDRRDPRNTGHSCGESLLLLGFPTFLRRLVPTLGQQLTSIPGLYLAVEEGRIEVPPFPYQAFTLLELACKLHGQGHLNLHLGSSEEAQALFRQWAVLAEQNTDLEQQDTPRHLCLSRGPSRLLPGQHLIVRGPYDEAWDTLARRLPGRRWSGPDQADLFPLDSRPAVTQALAGFPHYNLLADQDRRRIRGVAVRRTA